MANPSWDGMIQYVFQTIALGATTAKLSESFNVPRATQTITFIFPAQATDVSIGVEALSPYDKTTWVVLSRDTQGATAVQVPVTFTVGAAAVCYTVPATYFGTGTFRFVNATDQTVTTPIQIIFDRTN